MRHSSQLRIRIVVLMAKLESAVAVRRALQTEDVPNIPTEKTIRNIYNKFLETGSVHDRERPGRSSSITEEKKGEIVDVLQQTSMTSVRNVSREVNMSKSAVHRVMRDVLGYKPYKVQLTQQLYD